MSTTLAMLKLVAARTVPILFIATIAVAAANLVRIRFIASSPVIDRWTRLGHLRTKNTKSSIHNLRVQDVERNVKKFLDGPGDISRISCFVSLSNRPL